MNSSLGTRVEVDTLGRVLVPADRLWGGQTQRALEHFGVGPDPVPRPLILAYAQVKQAAALVNLADGRLPARQADMIVTACQEILAGRHWEMFPLGVWMSGSGTQLNMNLNEVIANRCCQLAGTALGSKEPVHPNDHVNMCQSTNDTYPTAMHLAVAGEAAGSLLPAVESLRDSLAAKAELWADVVRIGRTHLQDATPLTLGQEWGAFASQLADAAQRMRSAVDEVQAVTIGGTAVGTGVNSPAGFGQAMADQLAELTGLPVTCVPDRFAAQGAHDVLVHMSSALRTLAVSLHKIADDVRLEASGPRAGIGELQLPENEPGSSIMPGKVNPSQAEVMSMVTFQVMANDVAVGLAGSGGHLQMNAYKPLLIRNLLHSIRLLADASTSFRVHLVEGVEPDHARIEENVRRSLMLVTALAPVLGYDTAGRIARHAQERGLSLREAALNLGVISASEFDRIVDPALMVAPSMPPYPPSTH